MKWVGTPISISRVIRYSLMRLLSTPLPVMVPFFCAVAGGGVVLEVLNEGAGFGPFEQDLGLALIDLTAARHHGGILAVAGPRGGRRWSGGV
jgi:hypothetical protein